MDKSAVDADADYRAERDPSLMDLRNNSSAGIVAEADAPPASADKTDSVQGTASSMGATMLQAAQKAGAAAAAAFRHVGGRATDMAKTATYSEGNDQTAFTPASSEKSADAADADYHAERDPSLMDLRNNSSADIVTAPSGGSGSATAPLGGDAGPSPATNLGAGFLLPRAVADEDAGAGTDAKSSASSNSTSAVRQEVPPQGEAASMLQVLEAHDSAAQMAAAAAALHHMGETIGDAADMAHAAQHAEGNGTSSATPGGKEGDAAPPTAAEEEHVSLAQAAATAGALMHLGQPVGRAVALAEGLLDPATAMDPSAGPVLEQPSADAPACLDTDAATGLLVGRIANMGFSLADVVAVGVGSHHQQQQQQQEGDFGLASTESVQGSAVPPSASSDEEPRHEAVERLHARLAHEAAAAGGIVAAGQHVATAAQLAEVAVDAAGVIDACAAHTSVAGSDALTPATELLCAEFAASGTNLHSTVWLKPQERAPSGVSPARESLELPAEHPALGYPLPAAALALPGPPPAAVSGTAGAAGGGDVESYAAPALPSAANADSFDVLRDEELVPLRLVAAGMPDAEVAGAVRLHDAVAQAAAAAAGLAFIGMPLRSAALVAELAMAPAATLDAMSIPSEALVTERAAAAAAGAFVAAHPAAPGQSVASWADTPLTAGEDADEVSLGASGTLDAAIV